MGTLVKRENVISNSYILKGKAVFFNIMCRDIRKTCNVHLFFFHLASLKKRNIEKVYIHEIHQEKGLVSEVVI